MHTHVYTYTAPKTCAHTNTILLVHSHARSHAVANKDDLLNRDGNVALFAEGDSVILVHWVGGHLTSAMIGRVVGLEHNGTLKYATDYNSVKQSFRGHYLVHPNAGVRMWKDKLMRIQLPEEMKQLKRMFGNMLGGERPSLLGECHVCGETTLDRSESVSCTLCGLFFHLGCCERLFEWSTDTSWMSSRCSQVDGPKWHPDTYPEELRSSRCQLCKLCSKAIGVTIE